MRRGNLSFPGTFHTRLAAIVGLGLVIRLAHLFLVAFDNPLSGDAAGYHLAANLFADGLGFQEPMRHFFGGVDEVTLSNGSVAVVETPVGHLEPTAGHPPVWTIVMGTFAFLGATTVGQQQVVSALLGLPAVVLMGLLGRRLGSERLGLLSASITATYAFVWINDGLIVSETAAIAAAAAAMLAGVAFWQEPSRRRAIVLGLVGGVAALVRSELVLFLPLVAAVILVRAPLPWRERAVRYGICGCVALALCLPWFIRNSLVFNAPVLFSNGAGTVLVQANCDDTYYGSDIGYWSLRCGQPAPYGPNGELLDEYERDVVVRERATEYISENRSRLASVVIPARIGRMWGLYEPIGQLRRDVHADRRSFAVSVLGFVQFLLLVPTAVAGAVVIRRRGGPLLVLVAWLPIATLTAASAFGNTRYRTAAETSLVILAAVAVDVCADRLQRFRGTTDRQGPEPQGVTEQLPGGSS